MELEEHHIELQANPDFISLLPSIESTESDSDENLYDLNKLAALLGAEKNDDIPIEKSKTQGKVIFNVAEAEYDIVKYVGRKIFKWELTTDPIDDWDLFWTDGSVPIEKLAKMKPYQKVNHFPGMHSIARKNNLGRNLMKMKKIFPQHYKFFPKTFLLPGDYQEFKNQFIKNKKQKTFIIKPEYESQGKGIFLTSTWENIGPHDHLIAQKYLRNPCLIDGLKFDLRLYVLVTGCDPLRIYLHKDGLGRFATEPYVAPTAENLANTCMHLTNYAINKENPNFVFNNSSTDDSIGHKKSLKAVFNILREQGHDVDNLWNEIKKIIRKVLCSVQPILSHNYKSCHPNEPYNNMCFEILGFDVMIDDKFKPWLIEVNHLPSFGVDTPLDASIKKSVVKDTFQLLNISPKDKISFKAKKKSELHQRSMSTKMVKITPQEREEAFKKAQKERDEWEAQNRGGYEKIFPLDEGETADEDYQEFMKVAHHYWEVWTGTGTRKDIGKIQTKIDTQTLITEENQPKKSPVAPASPKKVKISLPSPRINEEPVVSNRRRTLTLNNNNNGKQNEQRSLSNDPAKTTMPFFQKKKRPSIKIQGTTMDAWNKREVRNYHSKKPSQLEPLEKSKEESVGILEKHIDDEIKPLYVPPARIDMTKSAVFLPKIVEKLEARMTTDPVNLPKEISNSLVGNPEDMSRSELFNNGRPFNKLAKTRIHFDSPKDIGPKEDPKPKHARQATHILSPIVQSHVVRFNLAKEAHQKHKNSGEMENDVFINKPSAKIGKTTLITLGIDLVPPGQRKDPIVFVKPTLQETPKPNLQAPAIKRSLPPHSCRMNHAKEFLAHKGAEQSITFRKGESPSKVDLSNQKSMLLQGIAIPSHHSLKLFNHLIRDMSKHE